MQFENLASISVIRVKPFFQQRVFRFQANRFMATGKVTRESHCDSSNLHANGHPSFSQPTDLAMENRRARHV
jgi:hypothetical protein